MWVPYDEQQLRRTIRFVARPQIKTIRMLGAVLMVAGAVLIALDHSSLGFAAAAVGLGFITVVGPITVVKPCRCSPMSSGTGFT